MYVEFWPLLHQILKSFGFVLQMEESKITLCHPNARVLIFLNANVIFLHVISLDLENESFSWEIGFLGNLGAFFHYKLNGHSRKDFLALVKS